MEFMGIIVVIGFVLIFGLLIFYSLRTQHQTEKRKKERAQSAGFIPLPQPSSQLSERIIGLYLNSRRKRFKISGVSSKVFPDGELVLFDLKETSGDDDTQLADQGLMIVSPYLDLPRFSLVPRLELGGKLAEYANRFVLWAASSAGKPIESMGHVEFDQRYWASGKDHQAIRRFLTPDRLDRLASLQNLNLEAGGDCFAFTRTILGAPTAKNSASEPPDLSQTISNGLLLFGWLSKGSEELSRAAEYADVSGPPSSCPQCGAAQTFVPDRSGIGTCRYCGSHLQLPLSLKSHELVRELAADPSPSDLEEGTWKQDAQDEWVKLEPLTPRNRLAQLFSGLGCMLPFGVVWTAFSAIFLVVGIFTYLNERKTYDLLSREGVTNTAVVTDMYVSTDSEGDSTYYINYEYIVPISGDAASFTNRQSVPKRIYSTLENGNKVEVLYAASQPGISELSSTFGPPDLMLPVCFGGMGLLFTLIGLGLIGGALAGAGRALFSKN